MHNNDCFLKGWVGQDDVEQIDRRAALTSCLTPAYVSVHPLQPSARLFNYSWHDSSYFLNMHCHFSNLCTEQFWISGRFLGILLVISDTLILERTIVFHSVRKCFQQSIGPSPRPTTMFLSRCASSSCLAPHAKLVTASRKRCPR